LKVVIQFLVSYTNIRVSSTANLYSSLAMTVFQQRLEAKSMQRNILSLGEKTAFGSVKDSQRNSRPVSTLNTSAGIAEGARGFHSRCHWNFSLTILPAAL
jgi:hypothetical protein